MTAAPPGDATTTTPVAGSTTVSTLSQLGAKVIHLLLNVVTTLAILRYLEPEAYGSYVLVVTVVTLVGVLADFGLPKLAVREMVKHAAEADEIVGTVAVLRLGLAVLAIGVGQLVLIALHQPPLVHVAAAIASVALLLDAVLGVVVVIFQVHVVQHYEALVRVAAEVVETALVLWLIATHAALLWLFAPPVVGLAVGLNLAMVFGRRRFHLRLRPVRRWVRYLLVEALPLGPALVISVIYLKLDSLVLAALRTPRDVGIYGSAYRPIEYLFLATAVIINVIFPVLARAYAGGEPVRFLQLYRRGAELLAILTVFVPVMLAFTAPAVIRLAYGPAYAEAAVPLQILACALVTMTLSGWQSLVLLSGGLQRVALTYNAMALGLALVLCTLGVWQLGTVGAALSALATSVFVLIMSLRAVSRRLQTRLEVGRFVRIGVAGALTAGVLAGLSALGTHWVLLALAGTVVYAVLLGRFGFHRTLREALT